MTELTTQQAKETLPYQTLKFTVTPADRSVLHTRIAQRFQDMLARGFVAEVENLYKRGDLHLDLPSMRTVGYRQIWHYLQGECSHAEAVEKGIIATRQLAKRQLTWLRGDPAAAWLDSTGQDLLDLVLKKLEDSLIYV